MIEYGLLGAKLGHSYSKPIHNLLADYNYELYAVTSEELQALMTSRAFKGLNVTIPYKKDVLPYLDEISSEVREVGSANTLVMGADGKLRGYNTDLPGFISMANRAGITLTDKKVVILGSGGTSLTAQAAARRLKAREIVVVSRSGSVNYDVLYAEHTDAEVIVNTTPVGMYPKNGESPIDLSAFDKCEGVLDVIYNPFHTALLQQAEERSIPCANGLWMLVAQAKYAAEYFTGKTIDDERIEQVYAKMRAEMANLVLIGMPGSGKSSIGRELARRMKREFVDMDQLIVQIAGKSIPEIFAEDGEEVFRSYETQAAQQCGREKGLVIASGGGAVTREATMRALSQNGEIIFIDRPLSQLATGGRPLSAGGMSALEKMYEKRMPLYRKYSCCSADNSGLMDTAVQAAMEGFYEAADR